MYGVGVPRKARDNASTASGGKRTTRRTLPLFDETLEALEEMSDGRERKLQTIGNRAILWVAALPEDLWRSILSAQSEVAWIAVARELARRQGMEFPEPSATELPPAPGPDHLNINRQYRDPDGPRDSFQVDEKVVDIRANARGERKQAASSKPLDQPPSPRKQD